MSQLKIGWAEENITPDKKVSLQGQFAERISEYVEKPITATALALDNGEEQAVFCTCELLNFSYELLTEVRKKFENNDIGLNPMKIMIGVTHVHTGPGYFKESVNVSGFRRLIESELPRDKKYVESAPINNPEVASGVDVFWMLVERVSKAIRDAWTSRKPGSFVNAFGRAAVGMCRRAVFSDGSAQMWGDTHTAMFEELEGGSDTGLELLYVFDENRKVTGVVANLACPAQCVQHRLFVSPDYWGEVKVRLRKYFGEDVYLLPQCSAAGDMCPVDLIRWVEPESDVNDPNIDHPNTPKRKADPSMFDLNGMRLAGRRVANEIIQLYEDGLDEPQSDPVFVHKVHGMPLPLRRVTFQDVAAAKQAIRDYLNAKPGNEVDYNDAARLQIYLGTLRRAERQEREETYEVEVHTLRLGNVAFATNPFELFLNYGNQIKARSLAEQTFLVQLTCGSGGYLPTEKAEKGGHYSAFVASGNVGHVGGEQLVRQTLRSVNELFPDKRK